MKTRTSSFVAALRGLLLALPLALAGALFAQEQAAAESTPIGTQLLPNGDFETSTMEPNWPDFWSQPRGGSFSWELEDGKRYIRINTIQQGETVLVYRVVKIPSDVKALEMSLRSRVIGLKCGPQPWFDARIMADFKSATGQKVKGAKTISFRKDTDGWTERKVRFLVPTGAAALELMPTLFQAYAGTFDIDDLQLTVIEPADLNQPQIPSPTAVAPAQ